MHILTINIGIIHFSPMLMDMFFLPAVIIALLLVSLVLVYPLLNGFGVTGAAVGLVITQAIWTTVYALNIVHGVLKKALVTSAKGQRLVVELFLVQSDRVILFALIQPTMEPKTGPVFHHHIELSASSIVCSLLCSI